MPPRKRCVFSSPKRKKKVRNDTPLSLEDKLRILDLIHSGKSCPEVGRMYNKSESTMRRIKRSEKIIREYASKSSENPCKVEPTTSAPPLMPEMLTLGDMLRIIDLVRNQNKEIPEVARIYGISNDDVSSIFVNEQTILERAAAAAAKNPAVPKVEATFQEVPVKQFRLSVRERLRVLDMLEHENKSFAEVSKMIGRSEGCVRHILSNSKRLRECGPLLLARQNDEYAIVKDEVMVKTEEALYSWLGDLSNRRIMVTNKTISQKAVELYKNLAKKSGREVKPFSGSFNWVVRFKQKFNIKAVEVTDNGVLYKCKGYVAKASGSHLKNGINSLKKPTKRVETNGHNKERTQSGMADISTEREDEDQGPSKEWTLRTLNDVLKTADILMAKIIKYDPSTERSTNITQGIIEVLEPFYEISDNLESEVDAEALCEAKQDSDGSQPSPSKMSDLDDTDKYYNLDDVLK